MRNMEASYQDIERAAMNDPSRTITVLEHTGGPHQFTALWGTGEKPGGANISQSVLDMLIQSHEFDRIQERSDPGNRKWNFTYKK